MPAFRCFELVDEPAGRFEFWEIAIDGPTLELRHGAVGTAGKHERETCSSEDHARNEYEASIACRLEAGFREVADRRLDLRTRDLEAAIDGDPDDASAYLVYADWIQTLGDPRGGLIVAQASGDPRAASAYLKQYESTFLGPLAEHVGYDGSPLDLTWRNGFIRRAMVREDGLGRAPKVFDALLEHPSARWLGELTITTTNDRADLRAIADGLATHRLPHLTSLELGEVGPHYQPLQHQTDLSKIWTSLPALRRLVIRGDADRLGELTLPQLAKLELHVRELRADDIHAIAGITGPLERLELRFRWPLGDTLGEQLLPIFGSPMLRGLDHLAITGVFAPLVGTDGLCVAIAETAPRSLRTLDLSQSWMTDEGAATLAESALDLEVIDVSRTRVSYRGGVALERIAKLVIS